MERRFTPSKSRPIKLEERADKSPLVVGYGAVFYDGTPDTEYQLWEDCVERIMPTAFDRAVKEDDVRGLKNHDPNLILGRTKSGTMRLSVDKTGLRYEIDLGKTSAAEDVKEELARGDVDGSSFAFDFSPGECNWREEGTKDGKTRYIREIQSVHLYDTGPVTFPAYESTSAGMRSVDGASEAHRSFEAWRADQKKNAQPPLSAILAAIRARAVSIS